MALAELLLDEVDIHLGLAGSRDAMQQYRLLGLPGLQDFLLGPLLLVIERMDILYLADILGQTDAALLDGREAIGAIAHACRQSRRHDVADGTHIVVGYPLP